MDLNLPFSSDIAQRFDALYQLLSRKYKIEQIELSIENHNFKILTVKNIDDLLDELIDSDPSLEEVMDERLPYWPEIWPSSLALSRYILEESLIYGNKKIIELGCGIGLVGMAVSLQGGNILLTDYQPDALLFAEMNWLLNLGRSPSTVLMDWRNPDTSQKYDIILASDIIYERRFYWPIMESFRNLLAPDGHIYLSEPNRKFAKEFFDRLQENVFKYKQYQMTEGFQGKSYSISVYDIQRSG
jgi:predicted nicotinamide N-methyase